MQVKRQLHLLSLLIESNLFKKKLIAHKFSIDEI